MGAKQEAAQEAGQARELTPTELSDTEYMREYVSELHATIGELLSAQAAPAAPDGWISTQNRMPPDEEPVLIIHRGEVKIGELRWERPGYEETYQAFRYWDDPTNDGQDWEMADVTYWMPIAAAPSAPAVATKEQK